MKSDSCVYVALTAGFALSVLCILTPSSQQPYDVYHYYPHFADEETEEPKKVKKEHTQSASGETGVCTNILTPLIPEVLTTVLCCLPRKGYSPFLGF